VKACPTGCGKQVAAGKLLCLHCWSLVPSDLQAEVHRTWRAYSKAGKGASMDDMRATRLAYQAAADAATSAAA
jgi:hypothetical protein